MLINVLRLTECSSAFLAPSPSPFFTCLQFCLVFLLILFFLPLSLSFSPAAFFHISYLRSVLGSSSSNPLLLFDVLFIRTCYHYVNRRTLITRSFITIQQWIYKCIASTEHVYLVIDIIFEGECSRRDVDDLLDLRAEQISN